MLPGHPQLDSPLPKVREEASSRSFEEFFFPFFTRVPHGSALRPLSSNMAREFLFRFTYSHPPPLTLIRSPPMPSSFPYRPLSFFSPTDPSDRMPSPVHADRLFTSEAHARRLRIFFHPSSVPPF